ncbi:protein of unknown function [Taphrina deformans PYCC 5710]|uniref:Uncharacterized protein n=1 Tax=Taphrina deformans (strain PYCC 5710 / ATCC 11124 / CBS 356.35 / IMI 108563 / JCM 9778 / NBRC 8474) TaxID=1097556 RepID=R4XKW9_TAPDE|nr:protein of unknown function [Taphrina deformans PYCC 5710]|eukprot:CCG83959.1 protein of unknown function [Taphrina deformans PYCC 5710]
MSRLQRQALRLRGAGRTFVDAAPIAFKSRLAIEPVEAAEVLKVTAVANVDCIDTRTPLAEMNSNRIIQKPTKPSGKSMDFRTPKLIKAAKAKTPVQSPPRMVSCDILTTPAVEIPLVSIDDAGLCSPLQFSTPTAALHEPCHATETAIQLVDSTPEETHSPFTSPVPSENIAHPSTRKRKLETMDIAVPINMSPVESKKRKLRGLLRELGPGASRFVLGAPNFATPARRKIFARRRQGRTFDTIAKELKKWKTGQSVKTYLVKHTTAEDEDRLATQIARYITEQ